MRLISGFALHLSRKPEPTSSPEKAAELGCRRVVPVFTRRTDPQRVNVERLRAHAMEAAEQCGLLSVPEVNAPEPLESLLAGWPEGRLLMFCDETGPRPPAAEVLRQSPAGPWAILVGPEGGFTDEEARVLHELPAARPVSLGPRIMRADNGGGRGACVVAVHVG